MGGPLCVIFDGREDEQQGLIFDGGGLPLSVMFDEREDEQHSLIFNGGGLPLSVTRHRLDGS